MTNITLRDLSNHLNLSQALISRVLNDKPGVWASEETKRRVREAARELNYHPSTWGRALTTGRSMQVALVVETGGSPKGDFVGAADVRGLLEAAAAAGYRVLLQPLKPGEDGELQLETMVRERACDGICVYSYQLTESQLRIMARHKLPCVVIGETAEVAGSSEQPEVIVRIDCDNYHYAYDSVVWLHGRGHTQIAWAKSPGEYDQPHNLELRRGYTEAMAQIGGTPIFLDNRGKGDEIPGYLKNRQFTAVITRYLAGTFSWIYHASLLGLRLPDDLAIHGHMEVTDSGQLVQLGLNEAVSMHCNDGYEVGMRAGQILTDWARGVVPESQTVLVRAHPPGFELAQSPWNVAADDDA